MSYRTALLILAAIFLTAAWLQPRSRPATVALLRLAALVIVTVVAAALAWSNFTSTKT